MDDSFGTLVDASINGGLPEGNPLVDIFREFLFVERYHRILSLISEKLMHTTITPDYGNMLYNHCYVQRVTYYYKDDYYDTQCIKNRLPNEYFIVQFSPTDLITNYGRIGAIEEMRTRIFDRWYDGYAKTIIGDHGILLNDGIIDAIKLACMFESDRRKHKIYDITMFLKRIREYVASTQGK